MCKLLKRQNKERETDPSMKLDGGKEEGIRRSAPTHAVKGSKLVINLLHNNLEGFNELGSVDLIMPGQVVFS